MSLESSDSLEVLSSRVLESPGSGKQHSHLVVSKVYPADQVPRPDREGPQFLGGEAAKVGSVALVGQDSVRGSRGASQDCCVPETC